MRALILVAIICALQVCIEARVAPQTNQNTILPVSSIYSGDIEEVKSSLNNHLETEQMTKFLDITWKFRDNAPRGESTKALKEIFALIFASKSSTSESDWLQIMSGDNTKLTQTEIAAIRENARQAAGDKWRLFKKLAQLRMSANNADQVIGIMNNLSGNFSQFGKGQKDLMIAALAAISGRSENETKLWDN